MVRICSIEGCGREHLAKGYCRRHYLRSYNGAVDPVAGKHGTVEQRFWRKVDKRGPDECWTLRSKHPFYGQMWDPSKKQPTGMHRFSYEMHKGKIPEGMYVLHQCDNKKCVNPAHLFLGTPQDNMDDMIAKGRGKATGTRGEESYKAILTEAKVRYIKRHPELSNVELGKKYGVVPNTIRAIRIGKSWAHIK